MSMSFTSRHIVPVCLLLSALALAGCGGGAAIDQAPAVAAPDAAPLGGELPPEVEPPEVKRTNQLTFEQAVAALQEGRLADAEILLLEITSDQPELAGPWINLGRVYAATGQPEEARLAFLEAVRANPRNSTAYNELGVLSRRYGDFAGAEEHYQRCIEVAPEFKDAYLNLGILYELYLGRLPEALELYRRYQSLLDEPDRRVQGWVMDLERRLGV